MASWWGVGWDEAWQDGFWVGECWWGAWRAGVAVTVGCRCCWCRCRVKVSARVIMVRVQSPRPSGSSGSGGKYAGKTPSSEMVSSPANAGSKGVATTTTAANTGGGTFLMNHCDRTGATSDSTDRPQMNVISPKGTCSSGSRSQPLVSAPNGSTSPSKHPSHHPLPLVTASHPHLAVHLHPVAPLAPCLLLP